MMHRRRGECPFCRGTGEVIDGHSETRETAPCLSPLCDDGEQDPAAFDPATMMWLPTGLVSFGDEPGSAVILVTYEDRHLAESLPSAHDVMRALEPFKGAPYTDATLTEMLATVARVFDHAARMNDES